MKKDFEQMATDAPKMVLTTQEKEQMRGVLTAFIEKNPIKVKRGFGFAWWKVATPFVVLVMGVGTTYAAEASLPGDLLYPVKINVTENVRGFVALSDESKATWEVERASRRLDEVEKLQLRGTLNAEVRADVEARFTLLAERAEDKIDALKASGKGELAEKLSARFEENLKARQEKIEQHRTDDKARGDVDTAADVEVDALIDNVRARVDLLETRHERREERREERRDDREDRREGRAEVEATGTVEISDDVRNGDSSHEQDRRSGREERREKPLRLNLPL